MRNKQTTSLSIYSILFYLTISIPLCLFVCFLYIFLFDFCSVDCHLSFDSLFPFSLASVSCFRPNYYLEYLHRSNNEQMHFTLFTQLSPLSIQKNLIYGIEIRLVIEYKTTRYIYIWEYEMTQTLYKQYLHALRFFYPLSLFLSLSLYL